MKSYCHLYSQNGHGIWVRIKLQSTHLCHCIPTSTLWVQAIFVNPQLDNNQNHLSLQGSYQANGLESCLHDKKVSTPSYHSSSPPSSSPSCCGYLDVYQPMSSGGLLLGSGSTSLCCGLDYSGLQLKVRQTALPSFISECWPLSIGTLCPAV